MIASCYVNRRRGYRITPSSNNNQGLLGSSTELELRDEADLLEDDEQEKPTLINASETHALKNRTCCGAVLYTPNTSGFANHWHSRFSQKFPFLVEVFYWAINLLLYVSVKSLSELIFATEGVWKAAEGHAITILLIEQEGLSFLFPVREVDVQTFFRTGHQDMLTVLNRAYSLIHIPVTVR